MLHELAAMGGTDYYATPMRVAVGRIPAITFMTDRPGGFTDADIEKFQRQRQFCRQLPAVLKNGLTACTHPLGGPFILGSDQTQQRAVPPGHRIARIEPQGLFEVLASLVALSQVHQGDAEVDVRIHMIGRQAQRFAEARQGLGQVPLVLEDQAEVVVGIGVGRVSAQRVAKAASGLGQSALIAVQRGQPVPCLAAAQPGIDACEVSALPLFQEPQQPVVRPVTPISIH